MQYSVLKKSELKHYDFGYLLFAPDFFLKDKLRSWDLISKGTTKTVSDYFLLVNKTVKQIDCESVCYDLTDGLPKFFDNGSIVDSINSNKKTASEGDFAISRMASYLEEMGIVEAGEKQQLFSTEFLIFREKTQKLSTRTLFALSMSTFVQTILKRGQYGTAQPRFYDFLMTKLPIKNSLLAVDVDIKVLVDNAIRVRQCSRQLYSQAQALCLSELGLTDWQPKHQLSFVKNYSDAEQAGRMDADYFQPKYDEIVSTIKKYKGGWDTLGNIAPHKKCVEVGSEEYIEQGVPFIRVSNLSPFEITEEKYISEDLYKELQQHQPQRGEILFSKDATPGIAYHLNEVVPKMIPSGGILRLKNKSKEINNECLTLILNSILTREQVNRDVGGSVILHWRPEQVKETLIPIIQDKAQKQIQQKVRESFELRKQSKHLLECAKQAVEMAIEKDEKTAIKWLEKAVD